MNSQFKIGCQVEGYPRPIVFWRLRRPNGQVVDAPCPQGYNGQAEEDAARSSPSNIHLNTLCNLRISNYSHSGTYWCSACSYVSQGSPECSPSLDVPGPSTLTVHVQGPPMQSETPPMIEQSGTGESAVVTVHYCAEPAPQLPREVLFSINQNDLQVGHSWQNFRFESMNQNSSTPNCYSARLHISAISDDVQSHQVLLKVTNSYGHKHFSVPLDALLGGNSLSSGELTGWIITLLVFLGVALVIALVIVCCVRKQLFCFNNNKSVESEYDGKASKSNLHVHENYSEDINGSRNMPSFERTQLSLPPHHSSTFATPMQWREPIRRCSAGCLLRFAHVFCVTASLLLFYSFNKSRLPNNHEGLNYAELALSRAM
uniref:Ig-like domain-containing protein n=1 Tax=Steinernema glaseri TaxID=37863 RepID=A0A1I8A6I4_9BILA